MIYEYWCDLCNRKQEEIHMASERPIINCHKCNSKCIKLISTGQMFCGVNGRADMYNFVDFNTTGKPVVINSKTQWKNHLKNLGLHDEVQNDPYSKSQVESKARQRGEDKISQRKKIKESVVEVYKTKRNTPEFKKRVKESISKDKNNKLLNVVK